MVHKPTRHKCVIHDVLNACILKVKGEVVPGLN